MQLIDMVDPDEPSAGEPRLVCRVPFVTLGAADAGIPSPATAAVLTRPSSLIDLATVLSADYEPPEPTACVTEDGVGLFYPGRVNGIFGAPESGKTWIALSAAAQALDQGESVLYVDADHNGAHQLAAWLAQAVGSTEAVRSAALDDRLFIAEPDSIQDIVEVIEHLGARQGVAVVDSVGELEAMWPSGADINDRYFRLNRTVMAPLAHQGWAVVTLDHLAKAGSANSAIGASAKKRALDGAYYKVTRGARFSPGRAGHSRMSLEKDRSGGVASALGDHDVTFEMREDGSCSLYVCEISVSTRDSLEDEVLQVLADHPKGLSAREIRLSVGRSDKGTRDALANLRREGRAVRCGSGSTTTWKVPA